MFSSEHGLAADQTLSFEVITSNGKVVTASPYENTDLYWALSGGVRTIIIWHPDSKIINNAFLDRAPEHTGLYGL